MALQINYSPSVRINNSDKEAASRDNNTQKNGNINTKTESIITNFDCDFNSKL